MHSIQADYQVPQSPLEPFYNQHFQTVQWQQIFQVRLQSTIDRKGLVNEILRQYDSLIDNNKKKVQANIIKLLDNNTFCIICGQQPGLLGGPLYNYYKSLAVIAWANKLNALYPDYQFVPIFWMASEDHDYAEVNTIYTHQYQKLIYHEQFKGAVGNHIITAAIRDITKQYPIFEPFYQPGVLWANAFRSWLHHCFKELGLIVIDANTRFFKQQFVQIAEEELFQHKYSHAINEQSSRLANAGYPLQFKPRLINLFWLDENGRYRIEKQANGFRLVGKPFSLSHHQLQQVLEKQPEIISPNAGLRPLFQEIILPGVAYIAGWGEIAYWLQLKKVFEIAHTPFPILIPRPSLTLITQQQANDIQKLGISPTEILQPTHLIRKKITQQFFQPHELIATTEKKIYQLLTHLEITLENSEPILAKNIRGKKLRLTRFFRHLQQKHEKIQQQHNPNYYFPLYRLKQQIQPEGFIQERTLGIIAFEQNNIQQIITKFTELADFCSTHHQIIII
jgi:bacillithiol biosynthesis cysteine-adding enzyme BshC